MEKEMATHSSILVWKNSMERGAWQATVHGVTKSDMSEKRMHAYEFVTSTLGIEH